MDELENTKVGNHEQRCLPHLADCVFQIAESCPDLFANEICANLLEKIRNDNKKVSLYSFYLNRAKLLYDGDFKTIDFNTKITISLPAVTIISFLNF